MIYCITNSSDHPGQTTLRQRITQYLLHPSVQTLIVASVSFMLVNVVSEGVCPQCPECLARADLTHTFVTFSDSVTTFNHLYI